MLSLDSLKTTLANTLAHLRAWRGAHGHWEGELSTSALSTATATFALAQYAASPACDVAERTSLEKLCAAGRDWLTAHQNDDGGWGDTTISYSNISTTALCWAALAGHDDEHAQSVARARGWLAAQAGGLKSDQLATAIRRRYGKDHTFSVPILTMLSLAGRLGPRAEAWRHVPQLPFELAACPHQWFAWLRLPVVSYALPALIAVGLVRHVQRASRNLPLRWLRNAVRKRTLRKLTAIQPSSGGFLEAAPLTSFVTMSLIGAGEAQHGVTRAAVDFLLQSVRDDGSWPIDTNLATWTTTLSVHALGVDEAEGGLSAEESAPVRRWLLEQQYRVEHPYTHAAPGGWAWTDLPGGVPDADDTPGALVALRLLESAGNVQDAAPSAETLAAATAGVTWLLDLQNSDGGLPTFCRGWGALPFDKSSADLTAHALRAWQAWREFLPHALQTRIDRAVERSLKYLLRTQQPDGSWLPLWFGNQDAQPEENATYGTSRVLLALSLIDARIADGAVQAAAQSAASWLLQTQHADGGWSGVPHGSASIEETALAPRPPIRHSALRHSEIPPSPRPPIPNPPTSSLQPPASSLRFTPSSAPPPG